MTKRYIDYLAEAERSYEYRIKVAGEVPSNFWDCLETCLACFNVISMTSPKSFPIAKSYPEFPELTNTECYSVDIKTRYPAAEAQLRQMVVDLGKQPCCVWVCTKSHAESKEVEDAKRKANTVADGALLTSDYDSATPDAKAASDDYATGKVAIKNPADTEITIAGGKTPPAKTTNDYPIGKDSPMSKIKRPPLPPTGRSKK